MDRGNKLWESHRIYLPEMREKLVPCNACVFLVSVIGREETRPGCVVSIPEYASLQRKVPYNIRAIDLMMRVGREGLQEIVTRGATPDKMACGLFRPKLQGKNSWKK